MRFLRPRGIVTGFLGDGSASVGTSGCRHGGIHELTHAEAAAARVLSKGVRLIATSCRAVVLPRFGGPEVLELRDDVVVPDLKPNEVLVRARAVSINPLDTRVSCVCYFSLTMISIVFVIF